MSYSLNLCLVAVSLCHCLNFHTKIVIKLEIERNLCFHYGGRFFFQFTISWSDYRKIHLNIRPELTISTASNYYYLPLLLPPCTVRSSKYLNQWLRTISHRECIITMIRSIAWTKHSPNIFFDFYLFIIIKWIGKTINKVHTRGWMTKKKKK